MTEDETIALAVACNLGRTTQPLGMNTGEVFATDQSYPTAELFAFADAIRADEREACAALAEACDDADSAARFIRARSNAAAVPT